MGAALTQAVIFDFYGTLGESEWQDWWMDGILADRGHKLDPDAAHRWSANAWDGREHDEHSTSAAHYLRWERARWRSMLLECGVPEADIADVLDEMAARRAAFRMKLYPESREVMEELRRRGVRLGVCSNWDWDLDEHLEATGVSDLLDARVSSAWVGVRKPHPRIFAATLDALGVPAGATVFVGDNWAADVEGPLAAGMRAVHVWRHDVSPGDWLPDPPDPPAGVLRIPNLRPLLDLVV